MATISVKVPMSGTSFEQARWNYNVSQHIDTGNDVVFVDANDGSNVNISRIFTNSSGNVCFWGAGGTAADGQQHALAAGVYHVIPGIHGITAANTSTGIRILVKI